MRDFEIECEGAGTCAAEAVEVACTCVVEHVVREHAPTEREQCSIPFAECTRHHTCSNCRIQLDHGPQKWLKHIW